jgi:hypothetical protein
MSLFHVPRQMMPDGRFPSHSGPDALSQSQTAKGFIKNAAERLATAKAIC